MQKFSMFILSGLALLLVLVSNSSSVYAQDSSTPEAPYQPAQVIVQFEDELSPDKLEAEISNSNNSGKGILTNMSKILSNILDTLVDKPSPQEQLIDILNMEAQAGVIEKTRMFDAGDESQSNTYLYTIDENQSVENVITLFETQPYVKYAQPNYLYLQESN